MSESDFRILVCGSRTWSDARLLDATLDRVAKNLTGKHRIVIVHGAARGADRMADTWAKRRGWAREPHPAQWDTYGKSAGPRRNQEMLDSDVHLVVAFRVNGKSPGTDHMVAAATRAGVGVVEVGPA